MLLSLLCLSAFIASEPSVPFSLPWDAPQGAFADARFLLDAPAGKRGFLTAREGHFYFADGTRARFWGTNLSGEACFPPKDVAPRVADRLARFGFNLVRFHGMDAGWGRGIFDRAFQDTQHFDTEQLDRLDYFTSQLEQRGIYINLNLHVGRRFTPTDGVPEAEWLGYAKYCTIFDPRMIELQKKYARDLLTHRNAYTQRTYAEDPAVIIVELTNENSLLGGWVRGQLRGKQKSRPTNITWTDIPPFYGAELTRFFNEWLRQRYPSRDALAKAWGVGARVAGEQILVNGDFQQGTTGWELSQREPASGKLEIVNEGSDGKPCAKVSIAAVSDVRWHIMLTQRNLSLKKGMNYRVACKMKASSPRPVSVEVCHTAPYRGYGSAQFQVGEAWQDFSFTFTAPEDDDSVRLSFQLGEATGTVWVVDALLHEAPIYGLRDDEDPQRGTVRRLEPEEFGSVTAARFRDEGRFYFETEHRYYEEMSRFLKKELGVRALVEGTNHNYGLPSLWAQSFMDLMDCHAYWQHPSFPRQPWSRTDWTIGNSPMLDEPQRSTIAALCRSSVAGKPFTVSEYNHPFPNEYGCESPLLLAAYAALQDWDAVYLYTFCHRWTERELSGDVVAGYFDVANEVSKMCQMPTAALLFLRGDVQAAKRLVTITYDEARLFDSLRSPVRSSAFKRTDGEISPLLPLVHRFRVARFDAERTTRAEDVPFTEPQGRIVSDTGELTWETQGAKTGALTINTPRLQAAMGWLKQSRDGHGAVKVRTADVEFNVETPFCAVSLVSLDGQPLRRSQKILVVAAARCANTGMQWNEARNSIGDRWGGSPLLIEPVVGQVTLQRDANAPPLRLIPLDGRGLPKGAGTSATREGTSLRLPLRAGEATVWYALTR
jgi:hypothetical protein